MDEREERTDPERKRPGTIVDMVEDERTAATAVRDFVSDGRRRVRRMREIEEALAPPCPMTEMTLRSQLRAEQSTIRRDHTRYLQSCLAALRQQERRHRGQQGSDLDELRGDIARVTAELHAWGGAVGDIPGGPKGPAVTLREAHAWASRDGSD